VIIQAPRGTIESLKRYNSVSDITGLDIYPIGYPPGAHSQFVKTNSEISMVGDYTQWMTEVAERKKPVWMTLQIAWSGVIKEGKTLRFPTFAEERFMTYQAIINGARGLTYFGGGLPKALNDEDRKLGWNWRFWNRVLRPVIEEIGAKSQLYPALVAPESKSPINVSGDGIEFCVREVQYHQLTSVATESNFVFAKLAATFFSSPASVKAQPSKLNSAAYPKPQALEVFYTKSPERLRSSPASSRTGLLPLKSTFTDSNPAVDAPQADTISLRFLGASRHCRTICASCGGKYGLGKKAVSSDISRPSDSAL
jgi:hypothetical protein